jgi:CRISPR/Cas system-associated exonuclease Cas4 (RecB family)
VLALSLRGGLDFVQRFTVSGSTLVHLWECPRCFWRRHRIGEKRPYTPSDETSEIADEAMVRFLRSAEWVDLQCGPGRVHLDSAGEFVESTPIRFPGDVEVVLSGRYDALLVEECGTLTLTDNKTSRKDDDKLRPYRRQLAAYAYALEHPQNSDQVPIQIDETGLWVYSPGGFATKRNRMGLYGETRWLSFQRNDSAFLKFLGGVADVLSRPEPAADPNCAWCAYRALRLTA